MNERKLCEIADIFAKHLKDSSSEIRVKEIFSKIDVFIQKGKLPKNFLDLVRRQYLAQERPPVHEGKTRFERKIASIHAERLYQLDMLVQQLLEARIAGSGG